MKLLARILTAILSVAGLAATVYFFIQGPQGLAVVIGCLVAILGVFVVKDIRKILKEL